MRDKFTRTSIIVIVVCIALYLVAIIDCSPNYEDEYEAIKSEQQAHFEALEDVYAGESAIWYTAETVEEVDAFFKDYRAP